MSNEYLVSTGVLVKEYLNEHKINQKTLAKRTGISEKHISNVLNGNSRLTEDFAIKLEKVIPDVRASYWLGYEAKYREYLARQKEKYNLENLDLKEISRKFRFKEVFQGLNLGLVEQTIEMLKLLKIGDFKQFNEAYEFNGVSFMEDGGDKESIAIWLNLCESEIEIQNPELTTIFEREKLKQTLVKFKMLSNNDNTQISLTSCRKLCNSLGIYFVTCEPITNCKVRGALTSYNGRPVIYISGRFKSHTHIWFALMHEIAHLVLHYNLKDTYISLIDEDENPDSIEAEASAFARNVFIDEKDYAKFIELNDFSKDSIIDFAKNQNTLPCFVVAFLKHDKKINYNQFIYL